MSVTLQESLSAGAEIIRELLQGQSAQEILRNIDLSDEYLAQMAAAMELVSDYQANLVVVLNDGETYTGLQGCTIRRALENTDETDEFGDVVMEM